MTHEQFINAVRDIVAANMADAAQRTKILAVKLTYGAAQRTRGTTYFNQWRRLDGAGDKVDFACLSAIGQESFIQLAGTTIHELAHVLAGKAAGHGKDWIDACGKLGLRRVKASGTSYTWANFAPTIREALFTLGEPTDGIPMFQQDPDENVQTGAAGTDIGQFKMFACSHGWGARGGKSRGAGSGSRMKKVTCPTCGYTCRVAQTWLAKGAPICPTDSIPMNGGAS